MLFRYEAVFFGSSKRKYVGEEDLVKVYQRISLAATSPPCHSPIRSNV